MFAKPGSGADRRAVALDLFIIAREVVGGLTDPQQHLMATGIVDYVIVVKVTPQLAASLAQGNGRSQRVWL